MTRISLLVVLVVLVGCGGSPKPVGPPTPPRSFEGKTQAILTVSFVGQADNREQAEPWQAIVRAGNGVKLIQAHDMDSFLLDMKLAVDALASLHIITGMKLESYPWPGENVLLRVQDVMVTQVPATDFRRVRGETAVTTVDEFTAETVSDPSEVQIPVTADQLRALRALREKYTDEEIATWSGDRLMREMRWISQN